MGGVVDQFEREEGPRCFSPRKGPDKGRSFAGERIGLANSQPGLLHVVARGDLSRLEADEPELPPFQ
eukprot:8193772-Lingulodinium_polyedra.AAC.1